MLINKLTISDSISELWAKLDGWLDAIILKLPNFVLAILVMVFFYFIAKFIKKLMLRILLNKVQQESIKQIISKLTYGSVILIGFFIALSVMQLDQMLTSILAGLGVLGLAVGLALQGTLSNTFSGVIISFLPKIRIGDFIETEDNKGFVHGINLWNVTIRRTDNEYVIIPNKNFIEKAFINYSWSERSRIDVKCRVDYQTDLEKVEDLVKKTIAENFEQKEGEKVEFFFTQFSKSAIYFKTRFWISATRPLPILEARHMAIKLIKKSFDEAGIKIPFPIRTLDFELTKNSRSIE